MIGFEKDKDKRKIYNLKRLDQLKQSKIRFTKDILKSFSKCIPYFLCSKVIKQVKNSSYFIVSTKSIALAEDFYSYDAINNDFSQRKQELLEEVLNKSKDDQDEILGKRILRKYPYPLKEHLNASTVLTNHNISFKSKY